MHLTNSLELLKFFVANLLVHCIHFTDQNCFSLQFPVVKRSVFDKYYREVYHEHHLNSLPCEVSFVVVVYTRDSEALLNS